VGLEISPRGYRQLTPTTLAASILEASAAATRALDRRTHELLAPFLPAGMPFEELASGRVRVADWAPQEPLTAASFDQWWGRFGSGKEGRR
jgi:hypothetical protein